MASTVADREISHIGASASEESAAQQGSIRALNLCLPDRSTVENEEADARGCNVALLALGGVLSLWLPGERQADR